MDEKAKKLERKENIRKRNGIGKKSCTQLKFSTPLQKPYIYVCATIQKMSKNNAVEQ